MLVLNDLRDKPGSTKKYKRVGRGKHNSPGHGGKGQTARTGVALGNFQGGQTPIERRLPKHRSFYTGDRLATVSLTSIDRLIEAKRIDPSKEIVFETLKNLKVIKKVAKFKVVGSTVNKIIIEANGASKGALESIEKLSGKVNLKK